MKKPALIILSALVLPVMPFATHAQLAPQGGGSAATNPVPPKPAPPAADPFSRTAPPSALTATKPKKDSAPMNLLTTLETWAVRDADALALIETSDSDGKGYAQLQALVQASKARLIGLTAISSKGGQRAVTQACDEVRYPTEFDPPSRLEDIAFPVSWETRDAGDLLELEVVRRDDVADFFNINIAPRAVRLSGFEEIVGDPQGAPISRPCFLQATVTTSLLLKANQPTILSVSRSAPLDLRAQATPEVHVQVLRMAEQAAPVPAPAASARLIASRVEFLVYKLDRADAARLLRESTGAETIHTALRDYISREKAVLESFTSFATHSGNRTVHEEYMEKPYGHGMNSPRYLGEGPTAIKLPGTPKGFDTRFVGTSVEIETVIDPETRYVDLNVVPSIVSYLGSLNVDGVAQRYPAQPLFSTRKITTSVTAGLGKPMLLGTMSQPRDNGVNGRKDDGKTSLAFIRVVPLNP